MNWLVENEYVAATFAKALADFGITADGFIGQMFFFLKEHIDKLIALGISSFGVYKWWRYREQILHRRLAEYLSESDQRLDQGKRYVLEALQRPSPGQSFKLPLFSEKALLSVMREQNWDRTPVATNVLNSFDWQLSDAMESIERKIQTAERTITSLRQQMATVHILKGAIASAGAKRTADRAWTFNTNALFSFKSALSIPGHEQDLISRELEAHQLRKLEMYPQALAAYGLLEAQASGVADERDRELLIARSKRYRAEILQAQLSSNQGGTRVFQGAGGANLLISANVSGSALDIRSKLKPFQNWDLLEEGDNQYFAAFIAHNLNFQPMCHSRLDDAETAYEGVLSVRTRIWNRRARKGLRRKAREGLARVQLARNTAQFDWRWICQHP